MFRWSIARCCWKQLNESELMSLNNLDLLHNLQERAHLCSFSFLIKFVSLFIPLNFTSINHILSPISICKYTSSFLRFPSPFLIPQYQQNVRGQNSPRINTKEDHRGDPRVGRRCQSGLQWVRNHHAGENHNRRFWDQRKYHHCYQVWQTQQTIGWQPTASRPILDPR